LSNLRSLRFSTFANASVASVEMTHLRKGFGAQDDKIYEVIKKA